MMLGRVAIQLEQEEGKIPHAYQDHLGYWTIGVGRLVDKRRGGGLSDDEIAYLLRNDILTRYNALCQALPWVSALDDARQAALLQMAFQMGLPGLLKFKTSLAHIEAGRWQQAHDNLLRSLWAQQTPARAKRVARQILTGEWVFRDPVNLESL